MRNLSLLLALFLFTATACEGGCGGCGKSEATIPAEPDARVQQMAGHLPTATEAALFVGDIEATQKSLTTLKDSLGQDGMVETLQNQFRTTAGIDPLDAESWKNAGVAPDSGFTIGYYRSRVIFMTYVENRQKFEKVLTEKTKKAFGIEAVVKSEKQGKIDMKVLSQDPARQIAWLYKGKLALVVLPATTGQGALQDGSARQVLATVAETTEETGLTSTVGWPDFKKRLAAEYPLTAYMNSAAYLNKDDIKEQVAQDPNLAMTAAWAEKNVKYVGAGLRVEDSQARLDVFAATSKEFVEAAKKVQTVAKPYDWKGFATEHTMLGLRVSVDPKEAWKLALDNLPEEDRRGFERRVSIIGEQYNIDIQQDVINKLTGNVGVFFYGVAGNPLQLLRANAGMIASKAGLLVVMPFESEAAVNALLQKLLGPLGQLVVTRPAELNGQEDASMTVVEMNMPTAPGRFYIVGENLVFATTAFGDSAIKKYIDNQRPEKRLAEVEKLDLGKSFATDKSYNGLYFNSERALSNLGAVLAFGGVGDILGKIEEAGLTVKVEDGGLAASLKVDLAPQTADGQAEGQEQNAPTPRPEPQEDNQGNENSDEVKPPVAPSGDKAAPTKK